MQASRYSILIAEDNRAMAQVLRFNLEHAGFQVCVAHDGLQAVGMLQDAAFDLLITDYQMPHMDGAELCRQVREELKLTNLPIVLCSAKGLETDAANLVATQQIEQVFFKPVSPQAIVKFVKSLLEDKTLPIQNTPLLESPA